MSKQQNEKNGRKTAKKQAAAKTKPVAMLPKKITSDDELDPSQPLDDPRREAFCYSMIQTFGNQQNAAILAGYSERTARTTGCRLAKRADVTARVAHLRAKIYAKMEMGLEEIIARISETARANMKDFIKDVRLVETKKKDKNGKETVSETRIVIEPEDWEKIPGHLIKRIRVTSQGHLDLTLHDSMKAQELLLRISGVLQDDKKSDGPLADVEKVNQQTIDARQYITQINNNYRDSEENQTGRRVDPRNTNDNDG